MFLCTLHSHTKWGSLFSTPDCFRISALGVASLLLYQGHPKEMAVPAPPLYLLACMTATRTFFLFRHTHLLVQFHICNLLPKLQPALNCSGTTPVSGHVSGRPRDGCRGFPQATSSCFPLNSSRSPRRRAAGHCPPWCTVQRKPPYKLPSPCPHPGDRSPCLYPCPWRHQTTIGWFPLAWRKFSSGRGRLDDYLIPTLPRLATAAGPAWPMPDCTKQIAGLPRNAWHDLSSCTYQVSPRSPQPGVITQATRFGKTQNPYPCRRRPYLQGLGYLSSPHN